MSQGYKICPICGTPSHRNATMCSTCGTSLTDVPVVSEAVTNSSTDKPRYDHRYGETDLLEGELHRRSEVYFFGGILVLVTLACVGGVAFAAFRWLAPAAQPTATLPSAQPSAPALVIQTNTPAPSPVLATVTPLPPTATNTPTPGPCTHKVKPGDDLISIVMACGHRSLDVLPLVLQMNNLSGANMIQVGQNIMVPWPTPTGQAPAGTEQPASTQAADASTDSGSAITALNLLDTPTVADIPGLEIASLPTLGPPTVAPTATLLPGVMWYTVQPNEDIAGIAFEFDTNVQVLSQLNPEITFSQCDYGNPAGGPDCQVFISAGQKVRVPAPTPTASLSPTLSGSETATPTLTPTYNAPSALSPADHALFRSDELVTLRWVTSGTLSAGDTYRVQVQDLTSGQDYSSDTTDLSFILPSDWQGQNGQRHDYRWTVSVISLANPDQPYFTTEPRLFTWEGR